MFTLMFCGAEKNLLITVAKDVVKVSTSMPTIKYLSFSSGTYVNSFIVVEL